MADNSNGYPKGGPRNPFNTYDARFIPTMQNSADVFSASRVSGDADAQKRLDVSYTAPVPVALPPHLYIPDGAQSIDASVLANIPPANTITIFRYLGLPGGITNFLGYCIFNDALMLSLIEFVPTINGVRVLPFHGNPDLNFKIGLGLQPDLATLIPVQLQLAPGDVLEWTFTNNDVVDVAAGVRMNGYFDQTTIRKTGRFGG